MLLKKIGGLIFLFLTLMNSSIYGDYYSANIDLAYLLEMETFLVKNLEDYMQAEEQRILGLRNYTDFVKNELDQAKGNSLTSFENPLNAWKMIKRMTQKRRKFQNEDHDNKNFDAYIEGVETYESETGISKPVMNDLMGAATGIARLQQTYRLETSDLANGIILGHKVSQEMTASDCYSLGMRLLDSNDTQMGITWLLEGHKKLEQESKAMIKDRVQEFSHVEDDEILEKLVPALLEIGNATLALELIKEQLLRNPQDLKPLENQNLAEALLLKGSLEVNLENSENANRSKNMNPTLFEMYEQTCRGELKQSPKDQRELRCRYVHNNVPFCLIAPFKAEELNLDPLIALYHEAIYENEIDNIIESAEDKVERSKIGVSKKNPSKTSEFRTSKNTWLYFHHYEFLKPIAQRLTDITGLSLKSAEALQVANYGIGGYYGPHYDFFQDTEFDFQGRGNRLLTALFYINDVKLGGATAFPYLRLAVPPIRRSLVIWYNLHRSLELDYRTKHAGCPVIKGFKWICNEWYHTLGQEFLRPCDLERDGYISESYRGFDQDIKYD